MKASEEFVALCRQLVGRTVAADEVAIAAKGLVDLLTLLPSESPGLGESQNELAQQQAARKAQAKELAS